MDKLRGSGSTFSTNGKPWKPFPGYRRKVDAQKARVRRLKQKGLTPQGSKEDMRRMVEEALRQPITISR